MAYLVDARIKGAETPPGIWYDSTNIALQGAVGSMKLSWPSRDTLKVVGVLLGIGLTVSAAASGIMPGIIALSVPVWSWREAGVGILAPLVCMFMMVGTAMLVDLQNNETVTPDYIHAAIADGRAVVAGSYLYVELERQLNRLGYDLRKIDSAHGTEISPVIRLYLQRCVPLRDAAYGMAGETTPSNAGDWIEHYAHEAAAIINRIIKLAHDTD